MTLSEKDGKLFYKLWLPLLDYVNEECEIATSFRDMADLGGMDTQKLKEIADVLWDNTQLIDQYLDACGAEIPDEHKEIIFSWKRYVRGCFIMERHLKKGTIFISEDNKVYQVQGIMSSWEEMFFYAPMPVLIEATFIPFRDVIISDGLVLSHNIVIGKNMAKQFKDIYMNAKKSGMLIKSL